MNLDFLEIILVKTDYLGPLLWYPWAPSFATLTTCKALLHVLNSIGLVYMELSMFFLIEGVILVLAHSSIYFD
jgi:hypothetical protein